MRLRRPVWIDLCALVLVCVALWAVIIYGFYLAYRMVSG